jgi:hypothetical protein
MHIGHQDGGRAGLAQGAACRRGLAVVAVRFQEDLKCLA